MQMLGYVPASQNAFHMKEVMLRSSKAGGLSKITWTSMITYNNCTAYVRRAGSRFSVRGVKVKVCGLEQYDPCNDRGL